MDLLILTLVNLVLGVVFWPFGWGFFVAAGLALAVLVYGYNLLSKNQELD